MGMEGAFPKTVCEQSLWFSTSMGGDGKPGKTFSGRGSEGSNLRDGQYQSPGPDGFSYVFLSRMLGNNKKQLDESFLGNSMRDGK